MHRHLKKLFCLCKDKIQIYINACGYLEMALNMNGKNMTDKRKRFFGNIDDQNMQITEYVQYNLLC